MKYRVSFPVHAVTKTVVYVEAANRAEAAAKARAFALDVLRDTPPLLELGDEPLVEEEKR